VSEPKAQAPAIGDQLARSGATGSRPGARGLALAAVLLAGIAAAFLWLGRDDAHTYRLHFANAGQLVKGDIVRIGGAHAGVIEAIDLTADSRAEVTISVEDEYAPLHRGTTVVTRAAGLIGVANRYVDVSPGPNFKPEMPDGAVLETEKTTAIVELDQLFDTLDPKTRKGLQGVIKGSASWYEGRERLANMSAHYFSPGIEATNRLVREINRDSETFQRFLLETSDSMGQLAERRSELTDWVGNTGETMRALSADTEALNQTLVNLPEALAEGSDTFAALRPATVDIERLMAETGRSTRDLAPFLRRLSPVMARSVPTFRQLRLLFGRPGAGNDLVDAMRDLPPLARSTDKAFPQAKRALADSTPMFSFLRPYAPDLTSFLKSFGGAMATYDANGHYARTMPVFDAFGFEDDDEGGHLEPKAPAQRGKGGALVGGNLRRCPGAAAPSPDGSAPFVDMGELANADCDPGQAVGR